MSSAVDPGRGPRVSPRARRSLARGAALLLLACVLPSCATNHLIRWSEGKRSIFSQPYEDHAPYVHPAGLVLAIPVTAVWDAVTWPFQWYWGVYPYGAQLRPDDVAPEPQAGPTDVAEPVEGIAPAGGRK